MPGYDWDYRTHFMLTGVDLVLFAVRRARYPDSEIELAVRLHVAMGT